MRRELRRNIDDAELRQRGIASDVTVEVEEEAILAMCHVARPETMERSYLGCHPFVTRRCQGDLGPMLRRELCIELYIAIRCRSAQNE